MHCHWLSVLSFLSVLLISNLATPPAQLWGDVRVMHTWNTVPANWESLGRPPAGTTIDLHIALKPRNENALIDALHEVSNPRHKRYRAHLSKEQVSELVTPHQDTLEIVQSWLEHHGVPSASISTSHGGGWLTITGVPTSQADELLGSSYQLYRHTGTNETNVILRTVSYALPAALHGHVQTVAPTTYFGSPRKRWNAEAAVVVNGTSGELARALFKRDGGYVTPSFLQWLYKTQAYVPTAMSHNSIGILGFAKDGPSQVDFTQFMTTLRADAEGATFTIVPINGGGHDPSRPGVVGNLDIQYAAAMTYPTQQIYFSTGGELRFSYTSGLPDPNDAYRQFLQYLIDMPNIPPTINVPYANIEWEFPTAYTMVLCNLFAQVGARGASVIVASGDEGVGTGNCKDERGKVRFAPEFPATCPWVTSVGGTKNHDPEMAAAFSGGGFSRHFPRPKYQDEAVLPYLRFLGPRKYNHYYRSIGRGVPDIASQAQRFLYVRESVLHEMSATACSTSTVAGLISLLNDYLISKGERTMGFLNLWLYDHGLKTCADITSGSNPGCGTPGYTAISGWDPVTGLGTLDFEILQAVIDSDLYDSDSDDDGSD